MARSPYYRLKPRLTLVIASAKAPPTRTWDSVKEIYVETPGTGKGLTLEIHAERKGSQATPEAPGLDTDRMVLECRIVKSPPGKPLDFPVGVKAGNSFPLTFVGRPGNAELLPTPDTQFPKLQKRFGRVFELQWRANG